ncbi:hypothetical protein ABZV77_23385 [Streptomyces sp. NPDC004732]|uniref:hypothetical protein n=1 Tax=Streptomyces sp. NPDC004732 TaxID=3154290 RepID=UPI0033AEA563
MSQRTRWLVRGVGVVGALAWSAAAGLTPDQEAIRQTLTGSARFAEELSSTLLAALGLPGAI